MSHLKVVDLPQTSPIDVAKGLRALADAVEAGEFKDAHNLVWVMDTGEGITTGLMGACGEPGVIAYYLLGLGMRKLEVIR